MAALLAVACNFDTSGSGRGRATAGVGEDLEDPDGAGDLPGDDPGDGGEGGGSADDGGDGTPDPSDGDGDGGDGDPGGDDSAPPSDDGNADGPPGGDDSPPPADCSEPYTQLLWSADAAVQDPMELLVASAANGDPLVAASAMENEGVVTFDVEFPCEGDYYAWGLVWDYYPGAWTGLDPDSFFVGTGGEEFVWRYGCQTSSVETALSWQPIEALQAQACSAVPIAFSAPEPGVFPISFRNRELGQGSEIAGIAAIIISNDAAVAPTELYAPY